VALLLIPFLYAEGILHSRRRLGLGRYSTTVKGPRIPRELWPEVAARVPHEGLRAVARSFGVSHETVRSVVRSMAGEVRVV
jgi:hypothetical protein